MQLPNGVWAGFIAGFGIIIIPIATLILNRMGVSVTRKTEIEKMCLARLATVEAQRDALQSLVYTKDEQIQKLRDEHITDREAATDRERALEVECDTLRRRLPRKYEG